MQRYLFVPLVVVALATTALLGCGGGGGGKKGGSNTPTPTDIAFVRVVAVASGTTPTRDLSNTVVNDSLIVQGIAVDYDGVATVVGLSGVTTTAPATVATVVSSTGVLTAVGPSESTYKVSGRYNGKIYSADLNVAALGTRVSASGNLRRFTGEPVAGTTIHFLSASGSTVASTTVGADGTYQANVPTGAARFTVDTSALVDTANNPLYYNEFSFGTDSTGTTLSYISTTSCSALLPSGGATPGVTLYKVSTGILPPVPNGCGGGGS